METFWKLNEQLARAHAPGGYISQVFANMGSYPSQVTEYCQGKVLEGLEFYNYLLSIGDKRVEDWALMSSPVPTLLITLAYLLFCLVGPRLMQPYRALSLRWVVVVYNLGCAGLNLYIAAELYVTQKNIKYSWTCEPVDYSWNPLSIRIAAALWWYYFSKLIEMADSVFIVVRKRNHQLTFLHVYHHATMFALWWIGTKYVAGGSSFLGAMFNCVVHVFMYTYYALAACGDSMRRYLWWKKYLTIIQILQFVAALVMGTNAIRIGCDFPMWMQYSLVAYMFSFIILFSDFYYKAYLKQREEWSQKRKNFSELKNGHCNGNGQQQNGHSNGGNDWAQRNGQANGRARENGHSGQIQTRSSRLKAE